MDNDNAQNLLIGAHTSIAGGLHHALVEGNDIGATTIQIFTANQRRWQSKPLGEDAIRLWHDALAKTPISKVMSHGSYLINLGAANVDTLMKSRQAFQEEVDRCHELNIAYLNIHPGAATGSEPEECLDRIVESLIGLKKCLAKGNTRLLLETTAGQGTSVGHSFEQLAYLIDRLEGHLPIGVCIDTCHVFVAGYDIRSAAACEEFLLGFDKIIGLKYLYAFHFNDSVKQLNSHVDRHADLGNGCIGLEAFRFFMCDPRTRQLPKYLETPQGPVKWQEEIALLRKLANSSI